MWRSKSSKPGRYGRSAPMEANACLESSMCCFLDWWQLKPVAGTALFKSPFGRPGGVQTSLGIFWGQGVNAIYCTHGLTEMIRCKNPWYNAFLTQCRDGSLSAQMCNYIHGFPTLTLLFLCCRDISETSCASPACRLHLRRDAIVGWYREGRKIFHFQGATGLQLMRLVGSNGDCHNCKGERSRRSRALPLGSQFKSEFQREPFSSAPAIYNFNVPMYFAMLLRALEFARHTWSA